MGENKMKKANVLVHMMAKVDYDDLSQVKGLKKELIKEIKKFRVASNPVFENPSYHVIEDPDDDDGTP